MKKVLAVGQRWRAVLYNPGDIDIPAEKPRYFTFRLIESCWTYNVAKKEMGVHFLGYKEGVTPESDQEDRPQVWWFDCDGRANVPTTSLYFVLKTLVRRSPPKTSGV